jgi:Flp pilus assembly protein TadB
MAKRFQEKRHKNGKVAGGGEGMNWKLRKFIQLFLIAGCSVAIAVSSALALLKDWRLGLAMFPLIGIVLLIAKVILLFDK